MALLLLLRLPTWPNRPPVHFPRPGASVALAKAPDVVGFMLAINFNASASGRGEGMDLSTRESHSSTPGLTKPTFLYSKRRDDQ